MEIWVLGDTRFMYEVFNAIAMITATDDWLALIRVGFILGMLLIAFKALISQKLELHHLMASFIIYGCLFVPKQTAVLIDAFDSTNIRAVDNVPLGVVFTASLLSKIGKGMTDLNEQGFQPIDPSQTSYDGLVDQGYLDPLKHLLELRKTMYSSTASDLDYNLKEYYNNCTARNLQNRTLTAQQIMNAPNVWQASRAPSPILTTTWSTSGSTSERTCFDADTDLNAHLTSAAHRDVLTKAVASVIGIKDHTQVLAKLEGPFQSIAGAGVTAYDYMFNVIQMQYLVSGADMASARSNDMTYAYIVQSARERRDLNHAVEKTLFEDIMRPIMTFFEALIYSVSPLMAFLFVIGPVAIKFVSKYILLAAWIQMWLPMFAIIKLFTYLALNTQMDSMQSNGLVPGSLEWAWAFQQNLSRWISISGWLTAATPTISLALVYGGAVTANSIASRMQSVSRESAAQAANTFSPGLLTVGPSGVQIGDQALQPQMTGGGYAFVRGMTGVQTPSGGAFEMKLSENAGVRQSQARLETAAHTASAQLMTQYARSSDFNDMVRSTTGASLGHASNLQTQAGYMYSKSDQWNVGDKYTLSEGEKSAISVLGGAGLDKFGFAAKVQGISESALLRQGVTDADQRQQMALQMTDQIVSSYNESRGLTKNFEFGNVMQNASRWANTSNDASAMEASRRFQASSEAHKALTLGTETSRRIEFGNLERTASLLQDPGLGSGAELHAHLNHLVAQPDLGPALSMVQRIRSVDDSQHWANIENGLKVAVDPTAPIRDAAIKIPANSEQMLDQLQKDGPPPTPVVPGATPLKKEVGDGLKEGHGSARAHSGLIRTPEQLEADHVGRKTAPEFGNEQRGLYSGAVLDSVADMRPTFATHNAQDAGSVAETMRNAIDTYFPSNADTVQRMVSAHQAQWEGLGMQVATYAHSFNPNENVSAERINFDDPKQQVVLSVSPHALSEVVGMDNHKMIKRDGERLDTLTREYLGGSDQASAKAGAELKAELTRMAGSEEGGARAFAMLGEQANRVNEGQIAMRGLMYSTVVQPDAGVVAPRDAQDSRESHRLFDTGAKAKGDNYLPQSGQTGAGGYGYDDIRGMVASDAGGLSKARDMNGEKAADSLDSGMALLTGMVMGNSDVINDNSGASYLTGVERRLHQMNSPDANPFGGNPHGTANLGTPTGISTREFPSEPMPAASQNSGILLGSIPADGIRPSELDAGASARHASHSFASKIDSLATAAAHESMVEAPNTDRLTELGVTNLNNAQRLSALQDPGAEQGLAFRERLLTLEAERAEGKPRDAEIRQHFAESFEGSSGGAVHDAYVASRGNAEAEFKTKASTGVLIKMEQDGSISDSIWNLFQEVPGGRGEIRDPKEGISMLQNVNKPQSDLESTRSGSDLQGDYLGRVMSLQQETATEIRSRSAMRQ